MRLGFLTPYSEQAVTAASRIGFTGLEIHASSWSHAMQAGKSAIKEAVAPARDYLADAGIVVTAVANYTRWIGQKPADVRRAFQRTMDVADVLGVKVITTLAGRDPDKGIAENIPEFKKIFTPVAKLAEDRGFRIAFENWSGYRAFPFKGTNVAYRPEAWDLMFEAVPSSAIGLEFDPSHLHFQMIDYVALIYRYAERIYHIHAKDTEILEDQLSSDGIYSAGWWRFRIPGWGDVDWAKFFNALYDIGYDGGIAIEHEDPIFAGDRFEEGLELGYKFLSRFVV